MSVGRRKPTFFINTGTLQKSEIQSILINKAYKFRIYPNQEQKALIVRLIGCSRFVFNCFSVI
ncbi:helix-turn-helix domain-containing protein [Bacillus paramycoides]|uniref:helix-turn-helix domain-containing protein n=1 Tax=Bacillus paramycoides TaxID=2026194 RepID=UPI0008FE6C82|nr:helix-turn-helix domain-containing protein [Bacillus paramycoides]